MTEASAAAEIASQAWADQGPDGADALAIALVRPVVEGVPEPITVISAYPSPMTIDQALDEMVRIDDFAYGSELLQVDELDGWSVLIQPAGWGVSLPEVAAGLSLMGDAISLFWNVNAVMSVTVARNGVVLRSFDPLLYNDGETPLPEEAGLPFGVDHPRAAALVLASRLSGLRIEREWLLGRARRTYRVAVPPELST